MKKKKIYAQFFNYPFWGWLFVFIFFLVCTLGLDMYSALPSTEEKNYTKLNHVLNQKIDSSEHFLNYLAATKDTDSIYRKGYDGTIFILYKNQKALAWTYNLINSEDALTWVKSNPDNRFISINNYNVLIKAIDVDSFKVISIIPIANNTNNQSLLNLYNARLNIDVNRPIKIDQYYFEGSHHITYKNRSLFYIQFEQYISTLITILTFIIFVGLLFTIIIWLYHVFDKLIRKIDYRIGIIIAILFLELLKRYFDFQHILPPVLSNVKLFDEQFLATTNSINSFAELILYILFYNMVFAVITNRVIDLNKQSLSSSYNRILDFLFILLINGYAIIITERIIHALIMDSRLIFNFSVFQFLDAYSVLGLLSIIVVINNYVLILQLTANIMQAKLNTTLIKRTIFFIITISCALLMLSDTNIWVMIALIVLNIINLFWHQFIGYPFRIRVGFNHKTLQTKPNWYWWFLIIASISTALMILNNQEKEHVIRERFAEKFIRKVDPMLEFEMIQLGENISNDYQIKNNIHPTNDHNKLFKYITNNYIKKIANISDFEISILNSNKELIGNSLNNEVFYSHHIKYNDASDEVSINYIEDLTNKYKYHFAYAIFERKELLGYIVISEFNIKSDNSVNELISRIRNPKNSYTSVLLNSYTTGYYQNGKLLSDYGNSDMPPMYNTKNITENTYRFDLDNSDLIFPYNVAEGKYLVVRYERNLLIVITTNFTYVMVGLFLLWVIVNGNYILFLKPNYLRYFYQNRHLSIRNKINFTIWGTVFISFIIIGIFTVYIFSKNENNFNNNYLREKSLLFTQAIQHMNIEEDQAQVKSLINFYAREMNLLINIYDNDGFILYNADHYINENNFISDLMNPEVKRVFEHNNSNFIFTNYNVNENNVLKNSYTILRDNYYARLGYLNIINLNNHSIEKGPISDLLLALINIYILIFLISSIVASLISNNVIKSFNLLINKFRKFNLKNNDLITWPYKDEVGLLIDEYNKMIRNVEQLANKLAMHERETVWREMAQQVAHEIKNPLTPMKLQIQYLQNAIQNNRPNIDTLTNKVCDVIIDQIDSLNEIATAFSNFAKTPQAHPEVVNIVAKINKSIRLFDNENHVQFNFETNQEDVFVFIDKNFIARAFTNLIKNAIQAIPDDREGKITIKLLLYKGFVYIEIEDNGVGIKEEEQSKIFSPYFTTKSSGTGIGLNMTKNIIESAGGKIRFKSVYNVGTKFIITLPEYRPNNRDLIKKS